MAVSNPKPTMTWTPGSDAHSGVAGYSWRFTTSKTEEADAAADGDATTLSATSTTDLSDGIWWFNVKTIDRVGNASTNLRYGPIVVDQNGPLGLAPTLSGGAVAQSDELGLEHFYPYSRHDLGTATGYLHLRTGNLVVQQEDVSIPGQGLNVVVRRTYNAQEPRNLDGLGAGWRLSVSDLEAGLEGVEGAVESLDAGSGLTLADLVSEAGTVVGQVLEFVDADGTTHRFVRQGGPGSRWDAPPGVSLRIFEETDAAGLVTAYRLVRPDGVTYRAENLKTLPGLASLPSPTWRVTSVTDRNANRLTYEHEAVTVATVVKPRLMRIKHSRTGDAVVVRFSYNIEGLLDAITSLPGYSAPDPASGTTPLWERRTALGYTSGRLTSVTEADHATVEKGKRTTGFSYDATTGLLAGVTDALGKTTSLAYTADAGAQRLTTVTDRRAKPWRYAYGPADAAGARTTTATSPVGTKTTYDVSGRGPVSESDRRVAGGNIATITDAGTDAGAVVSGLSWTQNRLTATTDGVGATTSYAYNDLGLVTKVTQPAPNAAGSPGLPADAPTGPVTSVLTYRFAAPWAYPGCTAPAAGPGPVSAEGYCEAVADLAQVRVADSHGDASRRVSDFGYDADTGRVTAVTQRANGSGAPSGADRTTSFTYYSRGGIKSIDGPRGDVADVTAFGDPADPTYGGYDRTGMPGRLTDALGKTKTLEYTPYGLVASSLDRDQRITTNAYDERDNLTETKDAAGAITRFAYDANDAKVKETSPRGTATGAADDHTTIWCHDATDLVVKVSEPGASAAAPAADPCANAATRLADRTESLTAYGADGTKASETNAAGAVVDFEYYPNASLKLTRSDTAAGVARAETLHLYDRAGRVRLTRSPVANAAGDRPETEWSFTPDGQVATEAATTAVSQAGQGVRSLITYAYNAHGEAVEASGPREVEGTKARQSSVYNTFGEVTESRRLLKSPSKAARDIVSRFGYDAAGHQTSASQPTGAGAELTSTFAFDAIGQLVAQTADPLNPGHTVEYAYTGEGQQRARVDKANGSAVRSATYTYNFDNTQASLVYTDNATGRTLASCNFAEGAQPPSGFDPDGNLLVSRTVTGTTGCAGGTTTRSQSFSYDGRDFLTATTQVLRAPAGKQVTRTQSFTYDPNGAHASATHSGNTTTYDHSPAGWLVSMVDWRGKASTVSYLPSGAPASHVVGGVAKATMAYHRNGSLSELVWRKNSAADPALLRAHTAVAYDTGGLRLGETTQVAQPAGETTAASAPGVAATEHDTLDRLVRWVSPFPEPGTAAQPATAYSLDDGGNIDAETKTAGTTTWSIDPSYESGRLSSRRTTGPDPATDDVFSYTALGEESSRTTTTAGVVPTTTATTTTYDPAGHTARVDQPGAAPDVDYVYDTADRLLARTEGLDTTLYFYWGTGGTIAEETDGGGYTKARYVIDDDHEVVAVMRYEVAGGITARWTWQLSDLAGNAASFVDDARTVVEQAAFDPYGKLEPGGSAKDLVGGAKTSLGFQGALTDKATGAVMLGARLYDPTTARFTTPDTYVAAALDVGLGTDELTANRYLFAGANPVAFYEDGHGLFGLKAPKLPSPVKALKAVAKKTMPVLQFVPVVSSGIDVVSAATGRDLANGGRKLSGAERALLLATAAAGAVPGAGSAAKAGLKVTAKLTKAKSGAKATQALARHADEAAAVCKNSFVPGTEVLMADGTTEAIEDVDIGDLVVATDPTTGETAAKAVTDLIEGTGRKELVAVTIDGHNVLATAGHPFWVAGRGWTDAGDLTLGDRVLEADGDLEAVTGLRYVVASATVHNLTVAGLHTYYVVVGEPVLVHNCSTSRTGFGRKLVELTSRDPANFQAHHTLPKKFTAQFGALGLDNSEARFGAWVRKGYHQRISKPINDDFADLFARGRGSGWSKARMRYESKQLASRHATRYGYRQNF
ncbi:MAG TPA: polymorphic toxin-type HINT domain-containing protein [Acidimicrobiales bacterium]|nr:polymorphic toxin-type HINT domain-containing protein [Acidimicrobiales bacterium]